jgi:hypothetical protein
MKNVISKSFTDEHVSKCNQIKSLSKTKYNLSPVNNILLICQKLKENSNLDGHYVECGTFQGTTLLPSFEYAKSFIPEFKGKFIGIDTFEGFPKTTNHHKFDLPNYFEKLYEDKLISEDHYLKARKRTKDFKDLSHLESEYFFDTKTILKIPSIIPTIELIKGTFDEVTPQFDRKISILHIDGDLYQSYLSCLNNLYDNVVNGGCIIFDEYYSHKYPGARVAVDEFFSDKTEEGYFEKYITEEGHERWCFTKNS